MFGFTTYFLFSSQRSHEGKRSQSPKNVYIQFDNAAVNKGWNVIIALSILVVCGIVDKIVIAFLLVGHTHTDVDHIISYVISYLRNMDIPTLDKLKEYVLRSFSPKVRVLLSTI